MKKYVKLTFLFLILLTFLMLSTTVSATDADKVNESITDTILDDSVCTNELTAIEQETTKEVNNIEKIDETKTINKDSSKKQVKQENNIKRSVLSADSIDDINVGETIKFNGYLKDIDQNPITDATINIYIDDEIFSNKTDNTGYFSYEYVEIFGGSKSVTISYVNTTEYSYSEQYITFNVIDSREDSSDYWSRDAHGKLTLGNSMDLIFSFLDKTVIAQFDGNNYTLNYDEETASYGFSVTPNKIGNYTIRYIFMGDDQYQASYMVDKLEVIKEKAVRIDFDYVNSARRVNIDKPILIKGYVCEEKERYQNNRTKIPNLKISYYCGDYESEVTTDAEGIFTIEFPPKEIGDYWVYLHFEGNENLSSAYGEYSFTVLEKKETIITIENMSDNGTIRWDSHITVTGNLKDSDGTPLAYKEIKVPFDYYLTTYDEFSVDTDEEGNFVISLPCKNVGLNQITLTFNEDDYYLKTNQTVQFTAKNIPASMDVEIPEFELYKSADIYLTCYTILTTDVGSISSLNLRIIINNETFPIESSTDSAYLSYTPTKTGTYNITIISDETEYYKSFYYTETQYISPAPDLYVYVPKTANLGDTITISGRLVLDGTGIVGETVRIHFSNSGNWVDVITGDDGYFETNYTRQDIGFEGIGFQFFGNDNFSPQFNSSSCFVKVPVQLYMYKIYNTNKGKTIKVSGKLLDYWGDAINGKQIDITVNGKKFTATSGKSGYFTINYTVDSYDAGDVTFSFAGDDIFSSCTNTTTFIVKKPVELYMYHIYNTNKGKTIKVSGKLLCDGKAVSGMAVNIAVNGKKFVATSGKSGYFTVNYVVDSYDKGSVRFRFAGSSLYESQTNTTTFIVKKPVELYMYKIYNTNKGKTIKVSGKLLCDGKAVSGMVVDITVNGKKFVATSGKSGYFTVNYTVDSYDKGSIKFRFAGSSLYESQTNTTTFIVKKPVELYMYHIYNTNMGKTIKVSGKLLCDGKAVSGMAIDITVNGKKFSAVTGGSGYFTVNYTVDSYDKGSVRFRFAGSSLYESQTNTTTFIVKKPTIIKVNKITTQTNGNTVKISGKLLSNTTAIKDNNMRVSVNGVMYTTKTLSDGSFSINYKINSTANHKVVYRFAGNSLYESSTNSTTFKVKQK